MTSCGCLLSGAHASLTIKIHPISYPLRWMDVSTSCVAPVPQNEIAFQQRK